MSVRSERQARREARAIAWIRDKEAVEQQNACSDQRHRWDRDSIPFKGQKQCRCGAVQGENPN